jgi:hypothetical protein
MKLGFVFATQTQGHAVSLQSTKGVTHVSIADCLVASSIVNVLDQELQSKAISANGSLSEETNYFVVHQWKLANVYNDVVSVRKHRK